MLSAVQVYRAKIVWTVVFNGVIGEVGGRCQCLHFRAPVGQLGWPVHAMDSMLHASGPCPSKLHLQPHHAYNTPCDTPTWRRGLRSLLLLL